MQIWSLDEGWAKITQRRRVKSEPGVEGQVSAALDLAHRRCRYKFKHIRVN